MGYPNREERAKREKRDARDEKARCEVATATYLQGLTDAAVIRQTSRLR